MKIKFKKIEIVLLLICILLAIIMVFFPESGLGAGINNLLDLSFKMDIMILGLLILICIIEIIKFITPKAQKERKRLSELYKDYTIEIEGEKNNVEDPTQKKEIIENVEIKNNKRFRIEIIPLFDHVNYEVISFDKENKIIKLRYFSDN